MKQVSNLQTSKFWNNFKQTMYALQVIVITLAIPLLTCLEMGHTGKPANAVKEKKEAVIKSAVAENGNATINISPLLASQY